MFALGIFLAIIGGVFGFRWFSIHKFEYLDGVKPSEQLDINFWLCTGFLLPAIALLAIGTL